MVRLQSDPIDVAGLLLAAREDGDGAVSAFVGTVRNSSAGRRVAHLEYEAYAGMAEREMERVAREAGARFSVTSIAIVHRVGRLEIGDASVAIVVTAPHRAQAMDACRFAIDTVKAAVPIWKREHFADGTATWIEG